MCNLYSMMSNKEAIREFAKFLRTTPSADNLDTTPDIFANGYGPIVRNTETGRELAVCRWGMPSSEDAIGSKTYDSGTTNIRRTWLPHWKPWLDIPNRCVVPATSFCEPDQVGGTFKNQWFALDESRPLFFFAGIWTPLWTSVRKVKEGETTADLYGFLTTAANADVAQYHDKAMPVILRTPEEVEEWFALPVKEIKDFQKSKTLPDGTLSVVSTVLKWDPPTATPSHLKDKPEALPAPAASVQPDLF
ncbi:SOS response-associated peptidase family protein [Asticcacaulis taihuensis]|jgi:putative SOS response-associated peptidase YedK|uniref:Abasic site processing protein n=1 Tax=Asticcacaulis taihuensis TaxID=260084 RepID=A0A1G4PWM8_9CAUL|nr:SOS response-associated peptidase family protein [Asticcacaulis taihuensis]SCW36676.1 Putative SOS response-associated peptidase YedK [Asticcacaulis taihuensis]